MKRTNNLFRLPAIIATALFISGLLGCGKSDPDPVNPPVAGFTFLSRGSLPVTVNFVNTSTSTGAPATVFIWNFGDGGTSSLQNPVHSYNNFGNYSVQLTQADASGATETVSKVLSIPEDLTIASGASSGRTADFTYQMWYAAPFNVTFFNSSVNGTNNVWNFGDGTTSASNVSSVMHTYNASGVYRVVLTTSNAGGSDSTVATITL